MKSESYFKFNSKNVKTLVSKCNTLIQEQNKKFRTSVSVELCSIDTKCAVIEIHNEAKHCTLVLRVIDGTTDKCYCTISSSNKGIYPKRQAELMSFICTFIYMYIVNAEFTTYEIVSSKSLCGVNMRLIRNKQNMYAWAEVNALVDANMFCLCNCVNLNVSKAGRVGVSYKPEQQDIFKVLRTSYMWETFDELKENLSRIMRNR